MFSVYVLRSDKTGRRYIGSTEDLERRLAEHNNGQSTSTRSGAPWRIVHTERFPSRAEAVRRERFLKSGQGRALLDRIEEAAP